MIEAFCRVCGSKFTVEESLAGQTARCGRCKSSVVIPDRDHFTREDDPLLLSVETAGSERSAATPRPPRQSPKAAKARKPRRRGIRTMNPLPDEESFWRLLPGCFVFALKGMNLVTFALLCAMAIVLSFFICFNFSCTIVIGFVIFYGAALYILFSVLLGSCEGESRLAAMTSAADVLDVLRSICLSTASFLWASLPGVAFYVGYGYWKGVMAVPHVMVQQGAIYIDNKLFVLCLLVSLTVFWPVTLVTAATYEYDLRRLGFGAMLMTILRSLSAYLAVIGCVLVCASLVLVSRSLLTRFAPQSLMAPSGLGRLAAAKSMFMVVKIYANLTVMRVIGLYFLCNRRLFT